MNSLRAPHRAAKFPAQIFNTKTVPSNLNKTLNAKDRKVKCQYYYLKNNSHSLNPRQQKKIGTAIAPQLSFP